MAGELAYLNGEFMALDDTKISALDRGFIFGDGLYEVAAVYGGKPFQLTEHLERYRDGAEEILLDGPSPEELADIARELLKKSQIQNGIIYLQVTRGAAPRTHDFPEDIEPTVFLFAKDRKFPDAEKRNKGIKTILVPDERWNRCNVKSVNLLPNCMYKEKAKREDAYEAIQVHRLGVTEGTSTNVFGVKNGIVYTAPTGSRILPGITRDTVIQLCEEDGIEVVETFLTPDELFDCDEVFITSTTNNILPVNQIDQATFTVDNNRVTFYLQEKLDQYILDNREE